MKRDKSPITRVGVKYIAPAILVISPLLPAVASGRGASCRRVFFSFAEKCTPATTGSPEAVHTAGSAPGPHRGTQACLNTESHIINARNDSAYMCSYAVTPNASITLQPKTKSTRSSATPATLMNHLGDVIKIRTRRPHPHTTTSAAHALGLAKITHQLTITELNNIPGGLHITPGEPITASELTEEQRMVLQNHRGLIREALRQLKASKAAKKVPVSG